VGVDAVDGGTAGFEEHAWRPELSVESGRLSLHPERTEADHTFGTGKDGYRAESTRT
jgi:hypothetical protein